MALVSVLVFAVSAPAGAAVRGGKGDVQPVVVANDPFVVTLGKAELISIDREFSDVLVANPSIVDVSALNANKLYLVGTNIGDTNLFVLDEAGEVVRRIDVHVSYDLQAIQSQVDRFFPEEDVSVKAVHDQIMLTGTAANPEKAQRITHLVGHYVGDLIDKEGEIDKYVVNMLEVRGEQQVMLRVKIVEASRSVVKELGLETRFNDGSDLTSSVLGLDNFNAFLSATSRLGLTQDPFGVGEVQFDTGIEGVGLIEFTLNALEQENLINTLAEPNLTSISGETAGFLAGGEFPVPVGRDRDGNIVVEFRPFGVSLNFRPTVLSEERISLQMETEVSALNFDDGVSLDGGLIIPAFDVRRASTTVEMGSGGSLMIAGLLSSESTKGLTGLPGIKDTPILGDLMESDSFLRDETEVLIIVTPYLVTPYADEEQAEVAPVEKDNPLAQVFAFNLNRIYGIREDDNVFVDDMKFGYLLD